MRAVACNTIVEPDELTLFAASISGIFVVAMHSACGFGVAPGWLVWYIIILLIRRRKIATNLANAESIIIDSFNERIAFRANLTGYPRWFALQIRSDFQSLENMLRAASPKTVSDGSVRGPSLLPIVFLLAVILTAAVCVAWFAVQSGPK